MNKKKEIILIRTINLSDYCKPGSHSTTETTKGGEG